MQQSNDRNGRSNRPPATPYLGDGTPVIEAIRSVNNFGIGLNPGAYTDENLARPALFRVSCTNPICAYFTGIYAQHRVDTGQSILEGFECWPHLDRGEHLCALCGLPGEPEVIFADGSRMGYRDLSKPSHIDIARLSPDCYPIRCGLVTVNSEYSNGGFNLLWTLDGATWIRATRRTALSRSDVAIRIHRMTTEGQTPILRIVTNSEIPADWRVADTRVI